MSWVTAAMRVASDAPPRSTPGRARASRRHRPRLQDVDLAALERPLDVLRAAEPLLEVVADPRQLAQVLLPQLLLAALGAELALLDAAALDRHDRDRLLRDLRLADGAVALEDVVV